MACETVDRPKGGFGGCEPECRVDGRFAARTTGASVFIVFTVHSRIPRAQDPAERFGGIMA